MIWNKILDKYYVGQTKDFYLRLALQQFNIRTGEAKNKNFAEDFKWNSNSFFIHLIFLQTKDELDDVERKYINKFVSFYNWYNKTGGNK